MVTWGSPILRKHRIAVWPNTVAPWTLGLIQTRFWWFYMFYNPMFHDSNRIHGDFEAWLPEINIYAGQTHICCLYKPPLFIASAPTFDYTIAISKCHVSLPLWKPLVSTDDQLISFTPGLFFTSFRNPQVHHFCCLNNKVCKIFMVNQPKKQQKRGRFVSMLFLFLRRHVMLTQVDSMKIMLKNHGTLLKPKQKTRWAPAAAFRTTPPGSVAKRWSFRPQVSRNGIKVRIKLVCYPKMLV